MSVVIIFIYLWFINEFICFSQLYILLRLLRTKSRKLAENRNEKV